MHAAPGGAGGPCKPLPGLPPGLVPQGRTMLDRIFSWPALGGCERTRASALAICAPSEFKEHLRHLVMLFCTLAHLRAYQVAYSAPAVQLDSYNRASSTSRSGKFARLFSARKSPKTPGSVAASPARSVSGFDNGAGALTPSSAPSMSLDDMLVYQNVRPPDRTVCCARAGAINCLDKGLLLVAASTFR